MDIPLGSAEHRLLSRFAEEGRRRHKYDEDFKKTQQEGLKRHGWKFIEAQEVAISAGFGGKWIPIDEASPSQKAQISRIVLALLDWQALTNV